MVYPPQRFKTIASEDISHSLMWFDNQRSENQWRLTVGEQLMLLGNVSRSLYNTWIAQAAAGQTPTLSDDTIRRLSVLAGIYKALEVLAPHNRPDFATRWFDRPNNNLTFGGQSVKAFLVANNNLEGFRAAEAYFVETVNGFLGGSYS